ncbi:MAG: cysteine desulfurase family protein [Candidatus Andeanibacterium colombiense]|uniref:Cysteine desulfurase n=1 Tax=Candidatus Andeanibacterium colombiense TaxID=3121345 RepID=A0AAJ5X4L5_9SPHN|nr:MAG: cysteine desulfurase family protein [Sphingomonadaceae bacterium]
MIYLDYQATTPLAPEARAAMLSWLDDTNFGNPHSAHRLGRSAAAAVEVAREQVAALLPAGGRVIFTSGATEALNLALRGSQGDVLTFATEHAAVLDCARAVEAQGRGFTVLPVSDGGQAEPDTICGTPGLVCAMLVNNEIGTINPLAEIEVVAHESGALVLCDAVQGYGRIAVPGGADMIALSAHKIHGPKGIGALWVRDGISLEPLIYGGGQEQGLRSGTLSPALCAGFGAAAKLAGEQMAEDAAHVETLWNRARKTLSDWTLNGSAEHRWKGNLNLRLDGLDVARLMSDLRGIAFSAGSACASGSGRPSHVLRAIGLSETQAKSSIRLGFGRYTTQEELETAARAIDAAAKAQ